MVANTDSEPRYEASDFEDYFQKEEKKKEEEEKEEEEKEKKEKEEKKKEEEEEKKKKKKTKEKNKKKKKKKSSSSSKPQQKSKHRLQVVAYQPGNHLKEGTQIFILLLDQQKVWKKVRLHTETKTACHCLC